MKKYNLNMDKLMRYLLDGNEFKYRYVYEKFNGSLCETEVSLFANETHIIFVRTLGFVELAAFDLSKDEEIRKLEYMIKKQLEENWDFVCNEEGIITS